MREVEILRQPITLRTADGGTITSMIRDQRHVLGATETYTPPELPTILLTPSARLARLLTIHNLIKPEWKLVVGLDPRERLRGYRPQRILIYDPLDSYTMDDIRYIYRVLAPSGGVDYLTI